MAIFLLILDLLVVLGVVSSVSRAVWRGNRSRVLSGVIIAAMIIFGLVSLCAANGLTFASSFNQVALLIALVITAVVARSSWAAPVPGGPSVGDKPGA